MWYWKLLKARSQNWGNYFSSFTCFAHLFPGPSDFLRWALRLPSHPYIGRLVQTMQQGWGHSFFSDLELLWGSEWQNCCLAHNHPLYFLPASREATSVHSYLQRSWKQNSLAQTVQISCGNVCSNFPIFFKDCKQIQGFFVCDHCVQTHKHSG